MSEKTAKGFMLFTSQKKIVDCLTDEEAGQLIKAIYAYAADGTEPSFDNRLLMAEFLMVKEQVDQSFSAYNRRCQTNRANAMKRRTSQTMASESMQPQAMADNNNDNNNDKNKNNPNDTSTEYITMPGSEDSFEKVWKEYGKPVGNKENIREKWNSLTPDDRKAAAEYIPLYVASRPNPQYRKNFENFLMQRTWETEPIKDYYYGENNRYLPYGQGQYDQKHAEYEQLARDLDRKYANLPDEPVDF